MTRCLKMFLKAWVLTIEFKEGKEAIGKRKTLMIF